MNCRDGRGFVRWKQSREDLSYALKPTLSAIILAATLWSTPALAQSTTEAHLLFGSLKNPGFAGGGSTDTWTATVQHASGWAFGDLFFFFDMINPEDASLDIYGEAYPSLSLAKISGGSVSLGPIRDISLLMGFNWAADANVRKYLPGVGISWSIPGFLFLNTWITAFLDGSGGVDSGGAPSESSSFMVDVNWGYPLEIDGVSLSLEGHIEYIGSRSNELGQDVSWWINGQPQLRLDLGKLLYGESGQLFIGTEYWIWVNKLGDPRTDEGAFQALLAWRF